MIDRFTYTRTSIVLLTALVALLGLPIPARATTPPPAPAVPSHTTGAQDGVPRFEPAKCGVKLASGQVEGSNVFCGYVVVPESHVNPDGPTIRLAVARFTSATPESTGGPIVYLEGGPGAPSLDDTKAMLAARYTSAYDFIAFDQRGVGQSEPALTCPEVSAQQRRDNRTQLSVDEDQDHLVAAMLQCHDRLAGARNLAAYTTAESAADVNDIRIALGYDRVRLFGASYGSRLGLTVLRDFPQIVSSAVIDAVSPPQADQYGATTPSVDRAVRLMFAGCAADRACNGTFPTLAADFSQLVDELDAEPLALRLRASDDAVILTGSRFLDYVSSFLYSAAATRYLPMLITQLRNRDTTLLLAILKALSGGSSLNYAMLWSVWCSDSIPFSSRDAAIAQAQNALPEMRRDFLPGMLSAYTICARWGSPPANPIEKQPVTSEVPTLVLASANDPVTPPAFAQSAVQTLSRSIYIETPGVGHTVTGNSGACGTRIVRDFFANPKVRPASDCMEALKRPFLTNTKRYADPPPMSLDPSRKYAATFTTTRGTFTVDLFAQDAPQAVNSFVFLANDHFLDNMDFAAITAQVIVSGDPTALGSGGPGYTIARDPVPANRDYDRNMLVMDSDGKEIDGGRFVILNADLRGKVERTHPIFGTVATGMDVVAAIGKWRAGESVEPRPMIISVTIQSS
jgi:pimeloyl-ACP methyl ester carboxylesterase/cyclophilin family peptidyl-prolyl cis-trans isomerase